MQRRRPGLKACRICFCNVRSGSHRSHENQHGLPRMLPESEESSLENIRWDKEPSWMGMMRRFRFSLCPRGTKVRVSVEGVRFEVSAKVISEASGLPNSGRRIGKDQTNQSEEMKKFLANEESFRWLDSSIARTSLPPPWDRVATTVMKFFTLEGKFQKLYGFYITFLNTIRGREAANIPLFLFESLEMTVSHCQSGSRHIPLHQGLIYMLYTRAREMARKQIIKFQSVGRNRKDSSVVTKAQLLGENEIITPIDSESEEKTPSSAEQGSDADSLLTKRKPVTELPQATRRSTHIRELKKLKAEITMSAGNSEGLQAQLPICLKANTIQVIIGEQIPVESLRNSINSLCEWINETVDALKKAKEQLKAGGSSGNSK